MAETRLSDRAVIRLHPTDEAENVREFLQGLVTNDVMGPLPVWAALLSAQGKCLFDFLVWGDGADCLIDCEADRADALAKRLSLYRLRRKIEIAADPDLAVHWSAEVGEGGADPRLPELGQRWLGEANVGDASAAYRAHRLALGVTEGLAELGDGATLWLECNAVELNGVSFTKGCYVGQENTARMNWRNKVNRRLVVVPLSDADEKRQMTAYPGLGLSVEHRRVEDLAGLDLPEWLATAINVQEE